MQMTTVPIINLKKKTLNFLPDYKNSAFTFLPIVDCYLTLSELIVYVVHNLYFIKLLVIIASLKAGIQCK